MSEATIEYRVLGDGWDERIFVMIRSGNIWCEFERAYSENRYRPTSSNFHRKRNKNKAYFCLEALKLNIPNHIKEIVINTLNHYCGKTKDL